MSKGSFKKRLYVPFTGVIYFITIIYIPKEKKNTIQFIKFPFKVCNNQTFRSQFIKSFLTIADNFIVMRAGDIKACQNTESITTNCLCAIYSLPCIYWDSMRFNII